MDEADGLFCKEACGSDAAASSLVRGTSTVCDPTCTASGSRFDGYLCGAGDSETFGAMCRMCYIDVAEAREAESKLAAGLHVIMCDTKRPPAAVECSDMCRLKKNTVRFLWKIVSCWGEGFMHHVQLTSLSSKPNVPLSPSKRVVRVCVRSVFP